MNKSAIAREIGFSRQRLDEILKQSIINEETYKKIHKFFPEWKFEKIVRIKYRIIRGDENDNNNNCN